MEFCSYPRSRRTRPTRAAAPTGEEGTTLVEIVVVLAILGILLPPIATVLYQFIWVPARNTDELTLTHDLRQAARWLSEDACGTKTFSQGTNPDYGTFGWVDYTASPVITYVARYYRSGSNLMRELTSNGSSSSLVIASNIQSYSDVSFVSSQDSITAAITSTIDSISGLLSESTVVQAQMRAVAPALAPTPDPATPTPAVIASDNFESDGWDGGSGWLYDWWHSGDASITSDGSPHSPDYHLRLQNSSGHVDRAVDLSGQSNVHFQFWAKVDFFKMGDSAEALVSSNGTTWHTVQTWTKTDSDNIYHFYDINLSPYTMSSEFWIAFDANMDDTSDHLYIDDVAIVR